MLLDSLKSNGVISTADNSKTMSAPTGFTAIDLLGASLELDTNGRPYINCGVAPKFYQKTGQSGQGKSTLALQQCAYAVEWWNKQYKQEPSDLIYIDAEDNMTIERVMSLTHWDYDYLNKHFDLKKEINLKNIYNFIMKLVNAKEKNKDFYYVDSPILNIDGKPLKVWASTYILIDSLAAIKSGVGLEEAERDKSGEIKEAEISGNIDAMREAKLNTDFIMKIKPLCNQYGIYLGVINHIKQEQKMSMFDIPKRYLVSLKPGEKLRGGDELIYQSYGIDRLTMKERLDERNPIYGDKINGFIAEFTYIKSKNHGENKPYRMVIDKRTGYRPELSDFEYLYSIGYGIGGAGASIYMLVLPEIKFSRKNLIDKCQEYPELARAIEFTAKYYIINDLVIGNNIPADLSIFTNLSLVDRLRYIYQYTSPYIGITPDKEVSDENEGALAKAKFNPNNNFINNLTNLYLDSIAIALLTPEDGLGSFTYPMSFNDFVSPNNVGRIYTEEEGYYYRK